MNLDKKDYTLENMLIVGLVYIPKDTKRIYAYPPLPQNSPYLLDLLPQYAFPDIISNPTYFIIPSKEPVIRLYGISMIYPTHALILLTYTLFLNPLTEIFMGYYPLFQNPTPQLLVTIFNSMKTCSLPSDIMTPPLNLFSSITKLMKLTLLPYKTVVYSKKISDASLSILYLLSAIPGISVQIHSEENDDLGFPLIIDTPLHPIIPHLPITLIDKLIGVEGYIIGTSHNVFSELSSDWDVVINLDTNKCQCKKELQAVLNDTREDRLFLIAIKEYSQRGQFDKCMKMIEMYYQGLLNTAAPFAKKINEISWSEIIQSPLNEYGNEFLKEWFVSKSFLNWKDHVVIDKALQHDFKHPGRTKFDGSGVYFAETITAYTVSDWMIKSAVKINNLYLNIAESMRTKNESNEQTAVEDGPVFESGEDDDYILVSSSQGTTQSNEIQNDIQNETQNETIQQITNANETNNDDENDIVDADVPIVDDENIEL